MSGIRTAAILSIGDEIVLGQKIDTNSGEIAGRLVGRGVRVTEHAAVADDIGAISRALMRLAASNDLIISTGGLGPTGDDLTRRSLAEALGSELVEDRQALAKLRAWAGARRVTLSAEQRVQALRPAGAATIENDNGTAPALTCELRSEGGEPKTVLCLPGPPREMVPILERFLDTRAGLGGGGVIRTGIVRVAALAEAEAGKRLGALMARGRNPVVGTTASGAVVDVRIRYEGPVEDADSKMCATEREVREAVSPYDLADGSDSLAGDVVRLLREHGAVLATAESCTGGLVARRVTDIAGSSDVFAGGWVTYSNGMKQRELGVSDKTLDAFGAVSHQSAREMALGALRHEPDASHALGVTGIAGPGGGNKEKPVGTVFIACARRERAGEIACVVRRFLFPGERMSVRNFAANVALVMLRFELMGVEPSRLLAEIPIGE